MPDHETTNVEAAAYRARLECHAESNGDDIPPPYELDEPGRDHFARFAPVRDGGWRMMDGSVRRS